MVLVVRVTILIVTLMFGQDIQRIGVLNVMRIEMNVGGVAIVIVRHAHQEGTNNMEKIGV